MKYNSTLYWQHTAISKNPMISPLKAVLPASLFSAVLSLPLIRAGMRNDSVSVLA